MDSEERIKEMDYSLIIPKEMWIAIFEFLDGKTLMNVKLSSPYFHGIITNDTTLTEIAYSTVTFYITVGDDDDAPRRDRFDSSDSDDGSTSSHYGDYFGDAIDYVQFIMSKHHYDKLFVSPVHVYCSNKLIPGVHVKRFIRTNYDNSRKRLCLRKNLFDFNTIFYKCFKNLFKNDENTLQLDHVGEHENEYDVDRVEDHYILRMDTLPENVEYVKVCFFAKLIDSIIAQEPTIVY